jgi:IS605 OrfB family transposase
MLLVEKHIIDKSHSFYKECDSLCFQSKNLYNSALHIIKNEYNKSGNYINYHEINKIFTQTNNPDYRKLPAKVSQQILLIVDRNYKSYFNALKSYIKNKSKFNSEPKSPNYKHKTNGRNIVTYTNQSILKSEYNKTGLIKLSGTNIKIRTKIYDFNLIQQVRIIPLNNQYKIEIVYNKQEETKVIDNGIYCGIDLGLNNLFSVVFNDKSFSNILVNGRPLKSINQYYNKERSRINKDLENCNKNRKKSNRLTTLTNKRNNKISDYLHKSTKILANRLKQYNVSKVIIGKNDNWKTEINIGNKNNQNFVSLPHAKAIEILTYKLELRGIKVICREESYTSKCSSVDLEDIKKHDKYVGKRIKRGLFRTKDGIVINADINAGANILRKEIPTAYINGIEGLVVNPRMLAITP